MKITMTFALLAVLCLYSCNKDDSDNRTPAPASTSSSIAGVYTGVVNVNIGATPNPPPHSTLQNHTMVFTDMANGKVAITSGNLIQTSLGTISGNTFTIPNTVANSTAGMITTEWGTAILNGNTLVIDLNQRMDVTGAPSSYGKWTGTLIRQ